MAHSLPFEVGCSSPSIILNTRLTSHQLKNPAIFKDKSYVNGEWVEAKSGKRFDIIGLFPMPSSKPRS